MVAVVADVFRWCCQAAANGRVSVMRALVKYQADVVQETLAGQWSILHQVPYTQTRLRG